MTQIVLLFAGVAAVDYIIGNKLGLAKEFERAFALLGNLILSMVGMIVLAPLISEWLASVLVGFYNVFKLDPSIIPASLLANDMGGASLASAVAINREIGSFNALVVASMMGCTVSFTIPFALGVVKKEKHPQMIMGLLCGIITIPIGCTLSGIIRGIGLLDLILNLLPLMIFSLLLCAGLLLIPNICIKVFKVFGFIIRALIIFGLMAGILNFILGKEIISGIAPISDGVMICFNAAVVMTGMLPLIYIVSRLLANPLYKVGKKAGINEMSAVSLFGTLAVSFTTFGNMDKMDDKGIVLNSAFAVSGAFVLADHLAFTMSFDKSYILFVIVGKLISGISAVALAFVMLKIKGRREEKFNENK